MKKLLAGILSVFVLCGVFTYDIHGKEIKIDHLRISNVTYTGKSIHHMPKVYDEEGERISRKYYTVIFDGDTTNAGRVDVHVTARNGASGEATGSYMIKRRSIRQCRISKLGTYKADDGFNVDTLTISYRGQDVSYRVSGYDDSIGKHTLTIYGLGNFTGKVKRKYKIIA